jgi:hypothetical protein
LARRKPATQTEIERAIALVAQHGQSEAARRLRVPRQTLLGWLKQGEVNGDAPTEVNAHEQEKLGLQDQVRALKASLAAVHRDNLTAEVVRKHILGLSAQTAEPPRWLAKPSKTSGVAGVPCTLWSDWHWGEVVDPAQLNGVNEYNMAIAQERARNLVERVIDLCYSHMTGADYPGIVVCIGGDMISGDIHDELSETNEQPTMPVMLDLLGVLAWALKTLADRFGRVFVPCVAGNHGRNTHKPRMKQRAYSNFDWLLANLLERHFADDKRIQFHIPAGTDANFAIYGHRYLLTHGDNLGVKGGDGIIGSLGPILRGTFKTSNASGAMGMPFDTILMGHWHQLMQMRRIIVNGSLKGWDEFAKTALRAPPEAPAQALWFTHPKHGITCQWPIYLGPPRQPANDDWVSWSSNREAA